MVIGNFLYVYIGHLDIISLFYLGLPLKAPKWTYNDQVLLNLKLIRTIGNNNKQINLHQKPNYLKLGTKNNIFLYCLRFFVFMQFSDYY